MSWLSGNKKWKIKYWLLKKRIKTMSEWTIPELDENNKVKYTAFVKFLESVMLEGKFIKKNNINEFKNQIKDIIYFIDELAFINTYD